MEQLYDRELSAESRREEKINQAYLVTNRVVNEAYLLNLIQEGQIKFKGEEGKEQTKNMMALKTSAKWNSDRSFFDFSQVDFKASSWWQKLFGTDNTQKEKQELIQGLQKIQKLEKILPEDVGELNFIMEKKLDQDRFASLQTTLKYDPSAEKLSAYFQKKIQERFEEEFKKKIEESEIDEGDIIAMDKVMPKAARQKLLWHVTIQEAKKIRIGFVRRKICEHLDARIKDAEVRMAKGLCRGDENLGGSCEYYNKQFHYYNCSDKQIFLDNYMSNEEIIQMSKDLGFSDVDKFIASFMHDPFAKIRSQVEITVSDAILKESAKNIKIDPKDGAIAGEKRFVEITPVESPGFFSSLWRAIQSPYLASNWSDLYVALPFTDDPKEKARSFYYEESELKKKLNIHQELFAREVFTSMMGDMSYLMGEDKFYVLKADSSKITSTIQTDSLAAQAGVKHLIEGGINKGEVSEEFTNSDPLNMKFDTSVPYDSIAVPFEEIFNPIPYSVEYEDEESEEYEEADWEEFVTGKKVGKDSTELVLDSTSYSSDSVRFKIPKEALKDSTQIKADSSLQKLLASKDIIHKKDSAVTKTLALQDTLIAKPGIRKETVKNPDQIVAEADEKAKQKAEDVKKYTMAEEYEMALDEDPLVSQMAPKVLSKNLKKKALTKKSFDYQVYQGDPELFDKRDTLELLKVDKTVIDGINYTIKHFVENKFYIKGNNLKNLGSVFDEMLKLYGLFEVVELGASEDKYDFAPTFFEQYILANYKVQQSIELVAILGLEETSYKRVKTDYIHNAEIYQMEKKVEDYKGPFIFHLARMFTPGEKGIEERVFRNRMNDFLNKAIQGMPGKMKTFCEAVADADGGNSEYKTLFRSSGGIRAYLAGSRHTILNAIEKEQKKKDLDEELGDEARTSLDKFIETLDIIGMIAFAAIMVVGLVAAGVASGGTAAGVAAPAWAVAMNAFTGFGGGAISATAMLLSPMNLIFFVYFMVPNLMRLPAMYQYPAQIRFQKTLMATQVLENDKITRIEDLDAIKSRMWMDVGTASFVIGLDYFLFVKPVIRGIPKHFGFHTAKMIKEATGREFFGAVSEWKTKDFFKIARYPKLAKDYLKFMETFPNTLKAEGKTLANKPAQKIRAEKISERQTVMGWLNDKYEFVKKQTSKGTKMARKGLEKNARLKRFFAGLDDYRQARKMMKTELGFAGLKTFLTGVPRMNREQMFLIFKESLIAKMAQKPVDNFLETHLKEVDYLINLYEKMVKKSTFEVSELSKVMSEEEATKAFQKGLENFYTEDIDIKVSRKFSEKFATFIANPRFSWHLFTKNFMTQKMVLMPVQLAEAIKEQGWTGVTTFFKYYKTHYIKAQKLAGDILRKELQSLKGIHETIKGQEVNIKGYREIVLEAIAKNQENTTKFIGKGHPSVQEVSTLMDMIFVNGFNTEAGRLAKDMRFLKTLEDISEFNLPATKNFRKTFDDFKYITSDFEPFEHITDPAYYMQNVENLTDMEGFRQIRESVVELLNSEADDVIKKSLDDLDEAIY